MLQMLSAAHATVTSCISNSSSYNSWFQTLTGFAADKVAKELGLAYLIEKVRQTDRQTDLAIVMVEK